MKLNSVFLALAALILFAGVCSAHPKKRATIAMDANGDDILLLQDLLNHHKIILDGVIVSGTGFSSVSAGVQNCLRVLETYAVAADLEGDTQRALYFRSVPVIAGSADPVSSSVNLETSILNVTAPPIRFLSGNLWFTLDANFPSAGALVPSTLTPTQHFQQLNGRINVLLTGPATDLAIVLTNAPHLARKMRVITMGGAVAAPGNIFTYPANTLAEFNVYLDPIAYETVLRNCDVYVIPLDATNDAPIDRDFVAALEGVATTTIQAQWYNMYLASVRGAFGDAAFYNDFNALGGGFFIWDEHTAQKLRKTVDFIAVSMPLTVDVTEGPDNPSGNTHKNYDLPNSQYVKVAVGINKNESDEDFLDWIADGYAPAAPSAKRAVEHELTSEQKETLANAASHMANFRLSKL
jgi:inosine-uridine nucleoside N-ribohydrolase